MNETLLLQMQIKSLEKSLIHIIKDINERINKLEHDTNELRRELDANNFIK